MSSKRAPVLIANRGEIAIRIARTCKALGFPTVAVFSEADRLSEHPKVCDQAICIGAPAPKESYLNVEKLLDVARRTGAKYVHPGYGFLSERAHFVQACEAAGLVFVGPTAETMQTMGDKIEARATIDRLGVPRIPGSKGAVKTPAEAKKLAAEIGYPILLKAAAGGGGKGMRRVDQEKDLENAFQGGAREALNAFGDGTLYLEKYILEPHHVEIQVFGDGKGGAIHLGERECSIQRRHQKVWEETPSPILDRFPATRTKMFEAALKICREIKYRSAGTLEFIVDGAGNFYFLEMNTRLQVEHPVTEWVTGADLVAWQLLLATGELKLPALPERRGAAIEVRIYAEDPLNFLPAPGAIGTVQMAEGPFVRVDSAYSQGGEVSIHYDPMVAKLSVWAPTRAEAVARMRVALDETRVLPPKKPNGLAAGSLKTNLPFLRRLVRVPQVLSGDTATDLIDKNPALTTPVSPPANREVAIAVSLMQLLADAGEMGAQEGQAEKPAGTPWTWVGRREGVKL